MAYVKLIPSTTIDPVDMNENFYHVGQGSQLPMGEELLQYTNTSNLGISSTVWANLYCNQIYFDTEIITSAKNVWSKIADFYVTSGSVTEYEVTGLNGDNAREYIIIAKP